MSATVIAVGVLERPCAFCSRHASRCCPRCGSATCSFHGPTGPERRCAHCEAAFEADLGRLAASCVLGAVAALSVAASTLAVASHLAQSHRSPLVLLAGAFASFFVSCWLASWTSRRVEAAWRQRFLGAHQPALPQARVHRRGRGRGSRP